MKSKIQTSLCAACVLALGLTVTAAQNPQPTQQPQPQPQQPSESGRRGLPSTMQHDTPVPITLTGCLVRDTAAAGSMGAGAPSSGAPQAPAGQSQATPTFRLKIEMNGRAPAGVASSGPSDPSPSRSADAPSSAHRGAAGVTGDAREYRLVPGANVDLSAHVNHRVQVTGARSSLSTGSMGAAPSAGMSSGSAQPPGSGASSNSGSGSAQGNASSKPAPNQSGGSEASQRAGSMQDSTDVPMLMVTNVTMIASTCQ